MDQSLLLICQVLKLLNLKETTSPAIVNLIVTYCYWIDRANLDEVEEVGPLT